MSLIRMIVVLMVENLVMAQLQHESNADRIYLAKYHLFGRKQQVVSTYLNHPSVSRIHMLIEWKGQQWLVKDKSTNGVWLNRYRLTLDQEYPLSKGDQIVLANNPDFSFNVVDLEPPRDVLVASKQEGDTESSGPNVIFLQQLQLLPNDEIPEVVVSFDDAAGEWHCEHLQSMKSQPISEGDKIHFDNCEWQFVAGVDGNEAHTQIIDDNQLANLHYIFRISQDEEAAELKVKHNEQIIDLDIRSHHYLTALLARYKHRAEQAELEDSLKGWIPIAQLARDLGLSESHINIHIHRARKQIMEQFQRLNMVAPPLIERRRGYARFASDNYNVFKGNIKEC